MMDDPSYLRSASTRSKDVQISRSGIPEYCTTCLSPPLTVGLAIVWPRRNSALLKYLISVESTGICDGEVHSIGRAELF